MAGKKRRQRSSEEESTLQGSARPAPHGFGGEGQDRLEYVDKVFSHLEGEYRTIIDKDELIELAEEEYLVSRRARPFKQGLTFYESAIGRPVFDFEPIAWKALGDGSSIEGYLDRKFHRFFQAVRETCERNTLDEIFLFRLTRLAERVKTFDHTIRYDMGEMDNSAWARFIQEPYDSRRHWLSGMIMTLINNLTGKLEEGKQVATVAKVRWKSSTAAFVFLTRQLLRQGYLDMPSDGGKAGDGNETELLRRLLTIFEVQGKKGAPLTPEQLRQRVQGYENRPLAPAKARRWSIPDAGEMK